MTPEERYTVVQTMLDQERIRLAQYILGNVQTRSPEETAALGARALKSVSDA